jgi:hypothetical protein
MASLWLDNAKWASRLSATSLEVTVGPLSALGAAWLSEKIRRLFFL